MTTKITIWKGEEAEGWEAAEVGKRRQKGRGGYEGLWRPVWVRSYLVGVWVGYSWGFYGAVEREDVLRCAECISLSEALGDLVRIIIIACIASSKPLVLI